MLTNEEIKETGLEIWQLNEIETWIGFGLEHIKEGALKITGCDAEDLFYDIRKVPVKMWDKMLIVEQDEKYSPAYTYRNYVEKLLNEDPDQDYPFCFGSIEF